MGTAVGAIMTVMSDKPDPPLQADEPTPPLPPPAPIMAMLKPEPGAIIGRRRKTDQ
jgi:hypothetical protein